VGRAGRDAAVGLIGAAGRIVIVRPFRILGINDAVGMHAVGMRRVVPEDDLDGVAHLRVKDRAHQTEICLA
jgi:hypothetical protein